MVFYPEETLMNTEVQIRGNQEIKQYINKRSALFQHLLKISESDLS